MPQNPARHVKVAEYSFASITWRSDNVPPLAVMSDREKDSGTLLKLKLICDVLLTVLRIEVPLATMTVGCETISASAIAPCGATEMFPIGTLLPLSYSAWSSKANHAGAPSDEPPFTPTVT